MKSTKFYDCHFQELMQLRTERYNAALLALHEAVAAGSHGSWYLQTDLPDASGVARLQDRSGRATTRVLTLIAGRNIEPPPLRPTRPDLLLIIRRNCTGNPEGAAPLRNSLNIVELIFKVNDRVHGKALADATAKHVRLQKHLETRGYVVKVLPIIMGSAGMIRTETQHHFEALGISAAASLALIKQHHNIAIDYSSRF